MRFYADFLSDKSFDVKYIEAQDPLSDIRNLLPMLKAEGVSDVYYTDPVDNWLENRLRAVSGRNGIELHGFPSPMFINTHDELAEWFAGRKRLLQNDFYIFQRKKYNILMDAFGTPLGGKWSLDQENRLRFPKSKKPPSVIFPRENKYIEQARNSVAKDFPDNYGDAYSAFTYPTTYDEADAWLEEFLKTRFYDFGIYEDAMVQHENILHHSVLSPLLNVGLLTPKQVVERTLEFANKNHIPLNSLEGFIRQIMGWREFVRGVYVWKGSEERTRNYWGFKRKLPTAFWSGSTGIAPIDITIQKVLKTCYAHHIERLMVLGNFMLLCEFDPDEVYRWFMEMFIDAYDWVMVPNVYGMSQFADGGIMATKPYICGSNYLLKMGDFEKGEWQTTWDALFWRFLWVHRSFFERNPRLNMLLRTFEKMDIGKQKSYLERAEVYLESLSDFNGFA